MRKEQTIPIGYESPQMEIIEVCVEQAVLQSSLPGLEEDDWV